MSSGESKKDESVEWSSLCVQQYKRPHNRFPDISQCRRMGYYSLSEERIYSPTAQQLKYFHMPSNYDYPLDLNAGIENVQRKLEVDYEEKLDHLLRFIVDKREKLLKDNKLCCHFVCFRGLLRLIMCTPNNSRNDWLLHVTRYKDTIYMYVPDTEEDKVRRASESEMQRNMCSWGFKFEQYCVSDSLKEPPNPKKPVNERSEFGCVFLTRFDDMHLLYSAEIDGIESRKEIPLDEKPRKLKKLRFVELKTRLRYPSLNQIETYRRFKMQNWWCQSYLAGVDNIYVGLRDDKGLVTSMETINVHTMPVEAEYRRKWFPNATANFLVVFLKKLQQTLQNVDCPDTVFEFKFNGKTGNIDLSRQLPGKTEHSFLPDWYTEIFKSP